MELTQLVGNLVEDEEWLEDIVSNNVLDVDMVQHEEACSGNMIHSTPPLTFSNSLDK